jgi:3-phosphoglycerate kinase
MTKVRTLDDIDIRGKRVLLRANLNVPMKNGTVTIRPALIAPHPRSSRSSIGMRRSS